MPMPLTLPIETGAVVIGAGPVGLFQVFQLGLLEVPVHIIDVLPHAGGQCMELYPDKPIYDIPGTPATSGRALAASLLQQIQPFSPELVAKLFPLPLRNSTTAVQLIGDHGTTYAGAISERVDLGHVAGNTLKWQVGNLAWRDEYRRRSVIT